MGRGTNPTRSAFAPVGWRKCTNRWNQFGAHRWNGEALRYISFLNKKWRRFYRQYPWVVNDHWSCHRLGKFSPQLLCLFSIKSQSCIFRLFSCSFTTRAIIWKQDNQMWVDEETEVERKGDEVRPTYKQRMFGATWLDQSVRTAPTLRCFGSKRIIVAITRQLSQPTEKSCLGSYFDQGLSRAFLIWALNVLN